MLAGQASAYLAPTQCICLRQFAIFRRAGHNRNSVVLSPDNALHSVGKAKGPLQAFQGGLGCCAQDTFHLSRAIDNFQGMGHFGIRNSARREATHGSQQQTGSFI